MEGTRIQQLVVRYDRAQQHAAVLEIRLQATETHLAVARRAQAQATRRLRSVAVQAYVSGGSLSAPLLTSSPQSQGMASVYVDVAGKRLQGAVDAFQHTQAVTRRTAASLGREETRARSTVRVLEGDQRSARSAVEADDALLASVKGNLRGLVVAAARRRAAEEAAAERRLAAREAAAAAAAAREAAARQVATTEAPAASPAPPVRTAAIEVTTQATPAPAPAPASAPAPAPAPSSPPATGGYADPLRAVGGLSPERIDQGVDYSGYGPIYAIGDGVVLSTVNSGWPGGTFIAYELSDGPATGLVVYVAEDVDPTVQVGEQVTPSTQLGLMYAGPDGIETGWAAPGGVGDTMAARAGQFSGANSTAFGANFSQLLESTGCPGGILEGSPTGALPAGWPSF